MLDTTLRQSQKRKNDKNNIFLCGKNHKCFHIQEINVIVFLKGFHIWILVLCFVYQRFKHCLHKIQLYFEEVS